MRIAAAPLPSTALALKRAHRKTRVRVRVVLDDGSEGWRWSRHSVPLKKFAAKRAKLDPSGGAAAELEVWRRNKAANFSKPPLGLGRTRKRKNKNVSDGSKTLIQKKVGPVRRKPK